MFARVVAACALLALAGCSTSDGNTAQADRMSGTWTIFIAAAIAVYAIVGGLILFAAVAFRSRDPAVVQAARFHQNVPLELTWTIVPIFIVGGLFWVTYVSEYHVDSVVRSPGEIVDVVGYRWSWRFSYPHEGVVVEAGAGRTPVLALPLGETTEIRLTSNDVIHAFWVPAYLFKRDAIPGRINTFDFTPTKSGTFLGRCGEYCGTYHAGMTFNVEVLPRAQFALWLRQHGGTQPS